MDETNLPQQPSQDKDANVGIFSTLEEQTSAIKEQVEKRGWTIVREMESESGKRIEIKSPEGLGALSLTGEDTNVFTRDERLRDVLIYDPNRTEVHSMTIDVYKGVSSQDEHAHQQCLQEGWNMVAQRRLRDFYEFRYYVRPRAQEEVEGK